MDHQRVKLKLVSQYDALEVAHTLARLSDQFSIENRDNTSRVNAKSIIGIMYAMADFMLDIYLVNETTPGSFPKELERFYD